MAHRSLSPLEQEICNWLLKIDRTWMPLNPDEMAAVDEDALDRLVAAGQIEAKLPVHVHLHESRRTLQSLWRVSGQYQRPLGYEVLKFIERHDQSRPALTILPLDFVAVRLATDGFAGKAVIGKILGSDREPSMYDMANIEAVTGGPDAKHGIQAKGVARFVEGDEPAADPPPAPPPHTQAGDPSSAADAAEPRRVWVVEESLAPMTSRLDSVDDRLAALAAAWPPAGGVAADGKQRPAVQMPRFSRLNDPQVVHFVMQLLREHGGITQSKLAALIGTQDSRLSERLRQIFKKQQGREPQRGEALEWIRAMLGRNDSLGQG